VQAPGGLVPQARQPYLGRRMRRTRRLAGTKSSISLMVSPMACSGPLQQGQTAPSMPSSISSRGRWPGRPLRPGSVTGSEPVGEAAGARASMLAISASRVFQAEGQLIVIESVRSVGQTAFAATAQ
jgi:hypothetical protein